MNSGLIQHVVTEGQIRLVALALALLIGLGGLSTTWIAHEPTDANPQPIAASCQNGGGGC
jgi:hypothetical protein